jgi:uncharacterized tellurite resistance protein B-like protein
MANNKLVLSLAKVLVSAAWVDGVVSNEEINSLKDLLFHLPGMTAGDWAEIDIYVESPVEEMERQRLIAEFEAQLTSQDDKELAFQALDQLVQVGGGVSEAERMVVEQIKGEIQNVKIGSWSRFIHRQTQERSQAMQAAPNRELQMDDFMNNRIYYDVKAKFAKEGDTPQISEADMRKLCLAGGLMARIAYVDNQVSSSENDAIEQVLRQRWGISPVEASLVAKIAVSEISQGLDYYRLTRQFFESTNEEERLRFLDVLFAVAASDRQASNEEMEDIRTIANGLLLTHQQFIDAKLRVPNAQREI